MKNMIKTAGYVRFEELVYDYVRDTNAVMTTLDIASNKVYLVVYATTNNKKIDMGVVNDMVKMFHLEDCKMITVSDSEVRFELGDTDINFTHNTKYLINYATENGFTLDNDTGIEDIVEFLKANPEFSMYYADSGEVVIGCR